MRRARHESRHKNASAAVHAAAARAADVVTIGESMVLFQPMNDGPLPYAPLFTRSIAGAESNVAIGLTRLGKKVRWISRLGTDPFGDIIASTLAGEGVDVSFVVRDATAPTAIYFKEFKGYADPNVYYYRHGSAASRFSLQDVRPEWLEGARHLHVTGITPALGPHTCEAVKTAMLLARERGLTISFDPNLRRKLWTENKARKTLLSLVPLCDVFLPGSEEAEFLLGKQPMDDHGRAFLDLGAKVVALKIGQQGALGFLEGYCVREPAYPISRIVDPIGAGDAFAAGFLSVLLDEDVLQSNQRAASQAALRRALERANTLGALATQYRGDWEGLPALAELEQIQSGQGRISR
jgi:2-dehydro-3-deoxygluconokinase